MPDRDAHDYACTLEGEHSMAAERLRREAHELDKKAETLRVKANWEDERAQWARMAANALAASARTTQRCESTTPQEDTA